MTPRRHSPPSELLRGEPHILRPSRIRATFMLAIGFAFAGIGVDLLSDGVWFWGTAGLLMGGAGVVVKLVMLLSPNALVLAYDDECFAMYTSFGRPIQRVRWSDIDALTEIEHVGWRGFRVMRQLAWRTGHTEFFFRPPRTGGTDVYGRAYDGALLYPYAGYEEMHELFTRMIHQSRARESAPAALSTPAP